MRVEDIKVFAKEIFPGAVSRWWEPNQLLYLPRGIEIRLGRHKIKGLSPRSGKALRANGKRPLRILWSTRIKEKRGVIVWKEVESAIVNNKEALSAWLLHVRIGLIQESIEAMSLSLLPPHFLTWDRFPHAESSLGIALEGNHFMMGVLQKSHVEVTSLFLEENPYFVKNYWEYSQYHKTWAIKIQSKTSPNPQEEYGVLGIKPWNGYWKGRIRVPSWSPSPFQGTDFSIDHSFTIKVSPKDSDLGILGARKVYVEQGLRTLSKIRLAYLQSNQDRSLNLRAERLHETLKW